MTLESVAVMVQIGMNVLVIGFMLRIERRLTKLETQYAEVFGVRVVNQKGKRG